MEKRKYGRYSTEVDIYFSVNYDLKTKVRYRVLRSKAPLVDKYPAVSVNISAEGMCFSSDKKLKKGDILYLEIYPPKRKRPVCMIGEVRWSKPFLQENKGNFKISTGVRLLTVSGRSVSESIGYSKKYKIVWSRVLESIFGSFHKLVLSSRRKDKIKDKC